MRALIWAIIVADRQYFMALGLLVDDRIDLAMSVVENFIFQIKHYNKVLNGNRTYVSLLCMP